MLVLCLTRVVIEFGIKHADYRIRQVCNHEICKAVLCGIFSHETDYNIILLYDSSFAMTLPNEILTVTSERFS